MAKAHTTLDLDRDLLADAAQALGTNRTTDTVHAALREVVARRRRAWLARRDFSELQAALPGLRATRGVDEPAGEASPDSDGAAS
jgi:Arc/MetJ family transcription regulator